MTDVLWGLAGLMDAIGGWATALLATLDQRFGLQAPKATALASQATPRLRFGSSFA
jgi:hypothetical protein